MPNDIAVALQARSGVTATGVVPAVLGGVRAGFRNLAISSSDTVPETPPGDSVSLARVTGTARLAGRVTISGGRVVADARVRVLGLSESTRTDTAGRFLLINVPGGTQTIQVIALGAAPAQVTIDVIPGAIARADVAMDRAGATLETVTVVGRPVLRPAAATGFAFRNQAGFGHFVNREDIDRQRPLNITDMFRALPGVALVYSQGGLTTHVRMTRSAGFGKNAGGCPPAVFVDYVKVSMQGNMSIDDFVRPTDVLAVELYPGIAGMPPFALGDGAVCGAVIIWTRLRA